MADDTLVYSPEVVTDHTKPVQDLPPVYETAYSNFEAEKPENYVKQYESERPTLIKKEKKAFFVFEPTRLENGLLVEVLSLASNTYTHVRIQKHLVPIHHLYSIVSATEHVSSKTDKEVPSYELRGNIPLSEATKVVCKTKHCIYRFQGITLSQFTTLIEALTELYPPPTPASIEALTNLYSPPTPAASKRGFFSFFY